MLASTVKDTISEQKMETESNDVASIFSPLSSLSEMIFGRSCWTSFSESFLLFCEIARREEEDNAQEVKQML